MEATVPRQRGGEEEEEVGTFWEGPRVGRICPSAPVQGLKNQEGLQDLIGIIAFIIRGL